MSDFSSIRKFYKKKINMAVRSRAVQDYAAVKGLTRHMIHVFPEMVKNAPNPNLRDLPNIPLWRPNDQILRNVEREVSFIGIF